jgi:hypothetical protein
MAEDERVAAAEAEVEDAKERLRMRTGSADTTISIAVRGHMANPVCPSYQARRLVDRR